MLVLFLLRPRLDFGILRLWEMLQNACRQQRFWPLFAGVGTLLWC